MPKEITSKLTAGEKILYYGRQHWITVVLPLIILVLLLFGSLWQAFFQPLERNIFYTLLILMIILIFYIIIALIDFNLNKYAVTTKKIITRYGWMADKYYEINTEAISDIKTRQSIFGKMMDYGTVIIQSIDGSTDTFKYITSPNPYINAVKTHEPTLAVNLDAIEGRKILFTVITSILLLCIIAGGIIAHSKIYEITHKDITNGSVNFKKEQKPDSEGPLNKKRNKDEDQRSLREKMLSEERINPQSVVTKKMPVKEKPKTKEAVKEPKKDVTLTPEPQITPPPLPGQPAQITTKNLQETADNQPLTPQEPAMAPSAQSYSFSGGTYTSPDQVAEGDYYAEIIGGVGTLSLKSADGAVTEILSKAGESIAGNHDLTLHQGDSLIITGNVTINLTKQ